MTDTTTDVATELAEKLHELAADLDVPGVSAGVLVDGTPHVAFHGVTSVENPLPVDETTLFQFGSTGKTFTATAVMRLVDEGKVDLDAPVRTYVPELKLKDDDVAQKVTVLQLFNHTAGWEGDFFKDTGRGDDSLERYVGLLDTIEQVTPLGSAVSYNNAALSLAGRVIEKVTGKVYEDAVKELLIDPLGLADTLALLPELMTRRFSVGHTRHDDGTITVDQPWALPRSSVPAGGWVANAADQLAWARFHLGDGTAPDGTRILSAELLERMQQPTVDMRGSALGDYVGISWLLKDLDGVRTVGHGGTTNGQYSDFTMVPSRGVAVICMANCGPNGSQLNHLLTKWALERFAGVVEREPEQLTLGDEALQEFVGRYETIAAVCELTPKAGGLLVAVSSKASTRDALGDADEEEQPPIAVTFVAGGVADAIVVSDGPAKGMKGFFTRDADGKVAGLNFGGRLATKVG